MGGLVGRSDPFDLVTLAQGVARAQAAVAAAREPFTTGAGDTALRRSRRLQGVFENLAQAAAELQLASQALSKLTGGRG